MAVEDQLQQLQNTVQTLDTNVGNLLEQATGKVDIIKQKAQQVSDAHAQVMPAAAAAVAAQNTVVPLATQVNTQYQDVVAKNSAMTTAVATAVNSAVQAQAARDAINTTGKIYPDAAAGVDPSTGVASNQTYAVISVDGLSWQTYKNNAGVATLVATTYTKTGQDAELGKRGIYEDDDRYLWKVRSPLKKLLAAILKDGTFLAKLGIGIGVSNGLTFVRQPAGNYVLSLGTKVGRLAVGDASLDASGNSANWLTVIRSPLRKWMFGVRMDGATLIAKLDHPVMAMSANSARFFVRCARTSTGWYRLTIYDRTTGLTTYLTAAGVPAAAPCIVSDRYLVYAGQRAGDVTQICWDMIAGEETPIDSLPELTLWGDSMTGAGSGYSTNVAALGYVVSDQGIGSQRIAQIAARAGALQNSYNSVTVTGGTIPASGSVACSAQYLYAGPPTDTKSGHGVLNGVSGTLTSAVSAGGVVTTTFTRDTAGAAVTSAPGSIFTPDTGLGGLLPLKTLRRRINIVWAGRNDVGKSDFSLDALLAGIEAIVVTQQAICPRTVIVGVTNGYADVPTSQGGLQAVDTDAKARLDQILQINAALAARWGALFYNPMTVLATAGFTDTVTVLGTAYQVINSSGTVDGIHHTTAAKTANAAALDLFIQAKGWKS